MKTTKKFIETEEWWKEHWKDMPEYNNKLIIPEVEVRIKFKTREDFEVFNKLLKKFVFKCNKVFDGNQTKSYKQAWFPPLKKGSDYTYE